MLDEATVLQITSASSLNSVQVRTCEYSVACAATFPGPHRGAQPRSQAHIAQLAVPPVFP